MSESYQSNTRNIGALFAKHLDEQRTNVTTVRKYRKATRSTPSSIRYVRDYSLIREPKPLCSGWAMDMMTVAQEDRSEANRVAASGDKRQRSFHAGGAVRLSDLQRVPKKPRK